MFVEFGSLFTMVFFVTANLFHGFIVDWMEQLAYGKSRTKGKLFFFINN